MLSPLEMIIIIIAVMIVTFWIIYCFFQSKKQKRWMERWKGGWMKKPPSHPNLEFYKNERISEPDGDYIENILKYYPSDYNKLEYHHGYIQWLFPNRMPSQNKDAFTLTDDEAKVISNDTDLRKRVMDSFRMMLRFYGMDIDVYGNFHFTLEKEERIKNMRVHQHNFLRITRILISLGEFNFINEQEKWLNFLKKMVVDGCLPEAEKSLNNFWIPAVNKFRRIDQDIYFDNID